jgi:hypothetical protein
MGESGKAVLALILIVGLFGTPFAWMADTVDWPSRIGFPAAGLAAAAILAWAMMRKDKAPDLLRAKVGSYWERDGFCFAIQPAVTDRSARLDVYFQNRYERPCRARVILQPSQQFFLNRRPVGSFTVEFECDGGAFGVLSLPWGVPGPFQGREQRFDVAASVEYPDGRGSMLRYRDGMRVGKASPSPWMGIACVAAAAGGLIVLPGKPAWWKGRLPAGVDETVPDDAPIICQTLWRPGDPWQGGARSKAKAAKPARSAHHEDAELAS